MNKIKLMNEFENDYQARLVNSSQITKKTKETKKFNYNIDDLSNYQSDFYNKIDKLLDGNSNNFTFIDEISKDEELCEYASYYIEVRIEESRSIIIPKYEKRNTIKQLIATYRKYQSKEYAKNQNRRWKQLDAIEAKKDALCPPPPPPITRKEQFNKFVDAIDELNDMLITVHNDPNAVLKQSPL